MFLQINLHFQRIGNNSFSYLASNAPKYPCAKSAISLSGNIPNP